LQRGLGQRRCKRHALCHEAAHGKLLGRAGTTTATGGGRRQRANNAIGADAAESRKQPKAAQPSATPDGRKARLLALSKGQCHAAQRAALVELWTEQPNRADLLVICDTQDAWVLEELVMFEHHTAPPARIEAAIRSLAGAAPMAEQPASTSDGDHQAEALQQLGALMLAMAKGKGHAALKAALARVWATTPHRNELLLSCDKIDDEHAYALEAVLKFELEHNTATPAQLKAAIRSLADC